MKQLSTPNVRLRRELVSKATNEQIFSLIECCFNILRARVPLSTFQKRKLKRHAEAIRKLARARSPRSARQLLMGGGGVRKIGVGNKKQTGRGILPVAAAISSIILPILHDYIYKSG